MTDLSNEIVDALRSIHDPCCRERGISVVDMGLVRSVEVAGSAARIELLLTSGWCPFASRILGSVKESAESVPGISAASVAISWDEAWTMDRLSEDARNKLVFLPEPAAAGDRDDFIDGHSGSYEQGGLGNDR